MKRAPITCGGTWMKVWRRCASAFGRWSKRDAPGRMMITSSFAGNGDRVASRPRFPAPSLFRPLLFFRGFPAFARLSADLASRGAPFTGIYRDACKNAGQKYSGRGYVKRAKFRSETLPGLKQDDIRSNRHARACRGHPRLKSRVESKTWMAGTSPAMTQESYPSQSILL